MRNILMGAVSAAAMMLAPVAMAQEAQTDIQERTNPQATTTQTTTTPAPGVTIEQDITVTPPAAQTEIQARTAQPQNQTAEQAKPAATQTAKADCAEMTIYFGFNTDAVLEEKQAEVAKKAESCKPEQIRVVGYTDEAGDADYNKMLGERRAESVKEMLVAMGVPAADIKVESKGEDEATGDPSKDRKVMVAFQTAMMDEETDENAG